MRLVPLLAVCMGLVMGSVQAASNTQAAGGGKSSSAKSTSAKGASKAKTTAPAKSGSKPKAKSTTSKSKTAPKNRATASNCARTPSAKGCSNKSSAGRTLNSPISADSLDKSGATSGDEIKARNVPDRAYAIDGQTFFHQGRRIRIEGLSSATATATGEHAKQRLQTLLDSGNISIEQIAIDDTGVATAQVRINGRDLAGQLNNGN